VIYQMTQDLRALLHAKGFPVRVHYGPEPLTRQGFDSLTVVAAWDRESGDAVTPVRGARTNPRGLLVRSVGVRFDLYAQASVVGARVNDHEALCQSLVDAVLVALYEWTRAARALDFAVVEARPLSELDGVEYETWPGCAYRLRVRVPRVVLSTRYDPSLAPVPRPTGSPASVQSRTDVTVRAAPADADPEIGCGG
jgi:hypothetical protein